MKKLTYLLPLFLLLNGCTTTLDGGKAHSEVMTAFTTLEATAIKNFGFHRTLAVEQKSPILSVATTGTNTIKIIDYDKGASAQVLIEDTSEATVKTSGVETSSTAAVGIYYQDNWGYYDQNITITSAAADVNYENIVHEKMDVSSNFAFLFTLEGFNSLLFDNFEPFVSSLEEISELLDIRATRKGKTLTVTYDISKTLVAKSHELPEDDIDLLDFEIYRITAEVKNGLPSKITSTVNYQIADPLHELYHYIDGKNEIDISVNEQLIINFPPVTNYVTTSFSEPLATLFMGIE